MNTGTSASRRTFSRCEGSREQTNALDTVLQPRENILSQKPATAFVLFWLVLNLLQITFTELTSDEGYYWFYSQRLQWGYYDHPPMVALLIKLGTAVFPGEAGVRFFNMLLSAAGLRVFLNLLPEEWKNRGRTYVVLLSAPLLHYLCFLVFPDGPLLFFSLLFLAAYKRFLQKATVSSAALLGLSVALMAWSKYHGALLVVFTVMANPKLLRQPLFYLSLAVAALLFIPHLWWQYQNGFPTFTYHLSGRTGSWSFRHVGEYLSQQVVATGPGLIFIPFVVKAEDVFERTLKTIAVGTFVFFLVSSAKTFVHFHWTSIALFPMLYLAIKFYNDFPRRHPLFIWAIVPFAVLMIALRFLLAVPVVPAMHVGSDYYNGREQWAKDIAAVAGDRPVFLPNNLREASLYSFYSGKPGVTLYTRPEKKTQYELWGYEDSLQGKEVFLVTKYSFAGSRPLLNYLDRKIFGGPVPSFRSYYNGIAVKAWVRSQNADSVWLDVELTNHRSSVVAFPQPAEIIYSVEQADKASKTAILLPLGWADGIPPKQRRQFNLTLPASELSPGRYQIYFGLRSGVLPEAIWPEPVGIVLTK